MRRLLRHNYILTPNITKKILCTCQELCKSFISAIIRSVMIAESLRKLSFSLTGGPVERPTVAGVSVAYPADDLQSEVSRNSMSGAPAEIDIDHITKSLHQVNNYSKRRLNDKLPPVLMYEITSTGESCYRSITLRELLNDVNDEASAVDEGALLYLAAHMQAMSPKSADRKTPVTEDAKRSDSHGSATQAADTHVHGKRGSMNPLHSSKPVYETRRGSRNDMETSSEPTYDATGTLRLRDLRRLDFQFNPNEERSVLIRRHAVLFAMDPIRAVVMAKRLILIVPDGADSLLSILDQYMKEWVSAKANVKGGAAVPHPRFNSAEDAVNPRAISTTEPSAPRAISTAEPTGAWGPTSQLEQWGAGARTQSVDSGHQMRTKSSSGLSKLVSSINSGSAATSTDNLLADVQGHTAQPFRRQRTEYEQRQMANATNIAQDLPFEMHAFEALLTTVMALETQEFNRVNAQVQLILNYFRTGEY
jgi:hypothetical protein